MRTDFAAIYSQIWTTEYCTSCDWVRMFRKSEAVLVTERSTVAKSKTLSLFLALSPTVVVDRYGHAVHQYCPFATFLATKPWSTYGFVSFSSTDWSYSGLPWAQITWWSRTGCPHLSIPKAFHVAADRRHLECSKCYIDYPLLTLVSMRWWVPIRFRILTFNFSQIHKRGYVMNAKCYGTEADWCFKFLRGPKHFCHRVRSGKYKWNAEEKLNKFFNINIQDFIEPTSMQ